MKKKVSKVSTAWSRRGRHKEMKGVVVVKKPIAILFLIIFFLLLVVFIINYMEIILDIFDFQEEERSVCGDGSFYATCSLRKPYFCDQGFLVERASICGCPNNLKKEKDFCVSEYKTNSKVVNLKYILDQKENQINFLIYQGMVDYLSNLPKSILYSGDEKPFRVDFKLRHIDETEQRELLLPLVSEIQNRAKDKETQFRIAVNLVQHISFGSSGKTIPLTGNKSLNYSRYPYEVLYDVQGVCGEKSELLAFLLKEIGYGVVLFYFPQENHEALGVKCPLKYSLDNSGYCFVETSAPSIITDNEIEYVEGLSLSSELEIMLISEGISLGDDLPEYKDAKDFIEIRRTLKQGKKLDFFKSKKLEELIKKYGLVEIYGV